jgi:hypothetical protein
MSRDRSAALAGVLYVALDVVVGVMAGAAPAPGASRDEIIAYIAANRSGLAVGLWLFGLATIPLLWWFGCLWERLVRAEAGTPRLSVVSLTGLLLGGTMSLASAVVLATLGLLPTSAEGVVTLYLLAAVFLAASGFGLGAHLVATNVLAARGHLIPGWLVAVGLVSAVAFLLAAVLGAVTTDAASTIVSLVGFVLWLCWILGVSYRMATTGPGSRGAAGSATTEVPVAGARGRQP